MTADVLVHGFVVAAIVRSANGDPVELHRLEPWHVERLVDDRTGEPACRHRPPGATETTFAHRDALFLVAPWRSLVMQAREAIGLALDAERHARGLLSRGARPAGILTVGKRLSDEALKRLRDGFRAAFEGADNAGKTLVLEDGIEFKALQFSSTDLQFLELRRFQRQEIARVFRVPLALLGDLERVTHSNVEHRGQQFLPYTILPWLKLWESALERLFDEDEHEVIYVERLVDDLVRVDPSARFDAYLEAVTNGILSPNEVRARENLPPRAGGDACLRPLNMEAVE